VADAPTRVRVHGLREFLAATKQADPVVRRELRKRLRQAGELVRDDAVPRFSPVDAGSAAAFGVSVRAAGVVAVEQRRRRTTGQHPEFGALQMRRALVPAGEAKSAEAARIVERVIDEASDLF